VQLCSWSVRALSKGVRRAHLIDPHGGQVLEELYTSAGTGMLIARDVYEGFREASVGDIPQIVELIAPLEEQGILTRRGREVIEADVERGLFHVLERDGQVLACAILKVIPDKAPVIAPAPSPPLGAAADENYAAAVAAAAATAAAAEASSSEWAELGCLAVNAKFRKLGRGEAMLGYLQRKALQMVRHARCRLSRGRAHSPTRPSSCLSHQRTFQPRVPHTPQPTPLFVAPRSLHRACATCSA